MRTSLSKKIKDETGKTYGDWTVLSFSHLAPNKGRNAYWLCKCVCGNTVPVCGTSLRKPTGKGSQKCKSCQGRTQMRYIKYKRNKGKDLYVIRSGSYIKIGTTNDAKVRLRSLDAGSPYEVSLVAVFKGAGELEEEWHTNLSAMHHKGEWFDLRK